MPATRRPPHGLLLVTLAALGMVGPFSIDTVFNAMVAGVVAPLVGGTLAGLAASALLATAIGAALWWRHLAKTRASSR